MLYSPFLTYVRSVAEGEYGDHNGNKQNHVTRCARSVTPIATPEQFRKPVPTRTEALFVRVSHPVLDSTTVQRLHWFVIVLQPVCVVRAHVPQCKVLRL